MISVVARVTLEKPVAFMAGIASCRTSSILSAGRPLEPPPQSHWTAPPRERSLQRATGSVGVAIGMARGAMDGEWMGFTSYSQTSTLAKEG